jgi:selenocysteine lyase/cysteine desulfurase
MLYEGGNPGRGAHTLSLRAAERVASARCTLAELFSLPDERCAVFTKNATEALNLGVHAFAGGGGHVLCCNMAHNALVRPLYALADAGRIRLELYDAARGAEAVAERLCADTVLVCATHASNICPFIADCAAIGRVCRAAGVAYLVDAAQSAGHIPLSLPALGADAVCVPSHKGLGGIMGAGAILFSAVREDLPQFLSGGGGASPRTRQMPHELPERFEAGTLPLVAIAAMEAGARDVLTRGADAIAAHIRFLEGALIEELGAMDGICLYTGGHRGGGVLSFTSDRIPPERLAEMLDGKGVAVRAGLHCAPVAHEALGTPDGGTVRVSVDGKTSLRDCRRLVDILYRLTRK